jgi:YVTN family beta-propeller protein
MKKMKKLLYLAFASLLFISCSSDDDGPNPQPSPPDAYENGILITNEGPFGNGSGTVSFISEDFSNVKQDIFFTVNGKDLGNIVNSMGFQDENAYIVVNNSQKIEVVNRYSFESIDSISSGLNNPRFFVSNDPVKAYVTNWGDPNDNGDDFVAVVDLRTNNVSATIPVSFGPERMISSNNKVYVAHQGGFGQNNLISVISGSSLQTTIVVGDAPNSMVEEDGILYVLCGGKPDYTGNETPGSLVKIDLSNNQIIETLTFGATEHPTGLTEDGNNLFYSLNGKVYKLAASSNTLPGTAIIDGFFYAMEAKDGKLYATDAGDFLSNGRLLVYDLATNQEIENITVGIIPGGIYFND